MKVDVKNKDLKISNHTKGILCVIAAAFGFSLMTFFVRLSGDLPTMQKTFFRNAVAAVIAAAMLFKDKQSPVPDRGNITDILMRCIFGTSGMIANFYAIDRLDIADANMLNKLSPFFAILLSIPILKEKPSRIDVWATIAAFIGALFIVRPSGLIYLINGVFESNTALPAMTDTVDGTKGALMAGSTIGSAAAATVIPALLGLYGGFGAGTAYVFVRKLGKKNEKTPVIVFWFSVFSSLVSAPFLIVDYHPMTALQWLILIGAGASAALGQFSITTAYKYAPAKDISVFDYTQVIFAAMWGALFLDELPGIYSFIGYFIIIGVAFFRWYINIRQSKETKKNETEDIQKS